MLRRHGEAWVVDHLGSPSHYTYQLEAFAAAVRAESSLPYDVEDAVPQPELIHAAYEGAGVEPRPAHPSRCSCCVVPDARYRTRLAPHNINPP